MGWVDKLRDMFGADEPEPEPPVVEVKKVVGRQVQRVRVLGQQQPVATIGSGKDPRPLNGMHGPLVQQWQFWLNLYFTQTAGSRPVREDGVFGPKTASVTRAFQVSLNAQLTGSSVQLAEDGIAGPETRIAMEKWVGIHASPPAGRAAAMNRLVSGGNRPLPEEGPPLTKTPTKKELKRMESDLKDLLRELES